MFYSGWIVFLVIWLALLIHCLRRREFYPICGRGWATKAFWLATFLLFSPWLLMLYLVFGVLLRPPEKPDARFFRPLSAAALALLAAILYVFHWPWAGPSPQAVVVAGGKTAARSGAAQGARETRGVPADRGDKGLQFHAGTMASNASSQVVSSSHSSGSEARVDLRRVQLRLLTDHALPRRVAAVLQKTLLTFPGVERVEFEEASAAIERPRRLPSVFLLLSLPRLKEEWSPVGRKIDVTVQWHAGSDPLRGPSYVRDSFTPPLVSFGIEGVLSHQSAMTGIESASARYKMQAESIAKEIAGSLRKRFDELAEKNGTAPDLPDYLYGEYEFMPELPVESVEPPETLLTGTDVFLHNRTLLRIRDDRPTAEVLDEWEEALSKAGWSRQERSNSPGAAYLRMENGESEYYLFREPQREPDGALVLETPSANRPKPLLIVSFTRRFSEEELRQATNRLLADPAVAPRTLLMFQGNIADRAQRERLRRRLDATAADDILSALWLAEYWNGQNEIERAKRMLLRARALWMAEKDEGLHRSRVEELAEKMGMDKKDLDDIPEATLREAGFIPLDEAKAGSTFERRSGEGLTFYSKAPTRADSTKDEDRRDAWRCVTLRLVPEEEAQAGRTRYVLEQIEAEPGSRSWGKAALRLVPEEETQAAKTRRAPERARTEPGNRLWIKHGGLEVSDSCWVADTNLTQESPRRVEIRRFGIERFQFTFQ